MLTNPQTFLFLYQRIWGFVGIEEFLDFLAVQNENCICLNMLNEKYQKVFGNWLSLDILLQSDEVAIWVLKKIPSVKGLSSI